ncbi:MAG: hypothetical protein KHY83_05515 [Coriobacteriia bacterium]|nr:hypothetical protein [Coriobacteriia bacterium]MBS5478105.1 hypothetical protein [Coriobacteriia bacterium]
MMTDDILTQLAQYVVWFFLYAFVGWAYEVVYSLIKHGRFINRGFFYGPVCPIYGAGALLAIALVGRIPNPVFAFAVGGLSAGVMEFVTSWVMERIFHARWWDYTGWPLNVQGRVCLASVVTFGVMMLLVSHFVQPQVERATQMLSLPALYTLASALFAVFAADFVLSVVHMQGLNRMLALLQDRVTLLAADASTRMSDAVDEVALRVSDALEWAEDASARAKASVERAKSEAADAWADIKAATSVEELSESLRAMLPRLGRTRVAGRELGDPDFAPTSAREAWELVKAAMRDRARRK